MKASGVKWVSRELFESPFSIGICLSEEQFKRELRRLKVPVEHWPEWIPDGKDGSVHSFERIADRSKCAIVCVRPIDGSDPNSSKKIAGLLVHEAVHIWQDIREVIGERNPGREFEAYAIQAISQRLIVAYAESENRGENDGCR